MNDQELYAHARDNRIPGGVQLRSKLPEGHAPGQWPAYFSRAQGIDVWDVDGRQFRDWASHGIGAALLGYRDPDVTRDVQRCVDDGSFSFLNPPEEVELADRLCELHPWAENVRFTRSGGEVATVAVRIARATTGRSKVAICGYHGWHDWYLAANLGDHGALDGHLLPGLNPLGVPRELRGTAVTFSFNDRAAFDAVIGEHGDQLACVIMEPCRFHDPEPGFLEHVRDATQRAGALLIYDEITIGFRRHYGGAHLRLGTDPDIAIFAKSLGNGHPMAAVIGTAEAMDGAHESFISSTYWTERVGPVAALATLNKMQRIDVPSHVDRVGRALIECWTRHIEALSLPGEITSNYPCFAGFRINHELVSELTLLFVQEMLERGFLAKPIVYLTLAHNEENLGEYDLAVGEVFQIMADALAKGDVQARLKGSVAVSGFRRLL